MISISDTHNCQYVHMNSLKNAFELAQLEKYTNFAFVGQCAYMFNESQQSYIILDLSINCWSNKTINVDIDCSRILFNFVKNFTNNTTCYVKLIDNTLMLFTFVKCDIYSITIPCIESNVIFNNVDILTCIPNYESSDDKHLWEFIIDAFKVKFLQNATSDNMKITCVNDKFVVNFGNCAPMIKFPNNCNKLETFFSTPKYIPISFDKHLDTINEIVISFVNSRFVKIIRFKDTDHHGEQYSDDYMCHCTILHD